MDERSIAMIIDMTNKIDGLREKLSDMNTSVTAALADLKIEHHRMNGELEKHIEGVIQTRELIKIIEETRLQPLEDDLKARQTIRSWTEQRWAKISMIITIIGGIAAIIIGILSLR